MDLKLHRLYKSTRSVKLRNKLVVDNMGIVHRVLYGIAKGPDYDDLAQAGVLGLITAIERFDASKGTGRVKEGKSSFFVFAKFWVRHEVQKANRKKRGISSSAISKEQTDESAAEILGYERTCERAAFGTIEARHDLRVALADCTGPEIAAMVAHADDGNAAELAAAMGLDDSRASRVVARVRTKRAVARARKALEQ